MWTRRKAGVGRGGRRSAAALACAGAAVLSVPGCTGLEPAMLGAAVSGAQTGVSLLSGAEIWIFEQQRFGPVRQAVDAAAEELKFRRINTVDESEKEGRYWVYFRFGDWSKLVVEVRQQTPEVTSVQVKVGDDDKHGMATLFLKRVLAQLGREWAGDDLPGQMG